MEGQSTLGRRGAELAQFPSYKERFQKVLSDQYDPKRNPNGFVNLGTAENYAMVPELKKFIDENFKIDEIDLTYGEGPWGSSRLRKAMSKHITKSFRSIEPLDAENLVIANGVTSLCEMLAFTIFDPGDGILLPRPIYQAFPVDFGTRGKVKCVYVPFEGVNQFSPAAVEEFEKALLKSELEGVHIRALMLCNPHNPLGQCYPKETIIALMKLCDKYKIHLLSDEIYASSVYEVPDENAVPFISVLSFDYSPYISSDYVHVYYGMSKDFAAGGLRLGCMYIKNKELLKVMSMMNQFNWSGNPSQAIAALIFEHEEWLEKFLALSRQRLAASNVLTKRILDDMGVKFATGANAGFFLWLDFRPYLPHVSNSEDWWQSEGALMNEFVKNKVFLTAGQALAAEEAGWFRIIFSHDDVALKEGLRRIAQTIGVKTTIH